mgnify:CR=1 FL=1
MATKKTQIITLVCNKGGVGRSTTAINIAWSLANKRCNVLVCDLDAQANTSSSLAKNYQEDVIEDQVNRMGDRVVVEISLDKIEVRPQVRQTLDQRDRRSPLRD